MKRLLSRVEQAANMQDPAPESAGADTIAAGYVSHIESDAPAAMTGAPPVDISDAAAAMLAPVGSASLIDLTADLGAVFAADAATDGTTDSLIANTVVARDSAAPADSFSVAYAAAGGSDDGATVEFNPVGSSTAPALLTTPAEPAVDSFATLNGGSGIIAAAGVPQQVPELHFPDNIDAGAAAGDAATVPTILASLVNAPVDDFTTPVTESAVGADGATGAQVRAALDDSGLNVNGSGIRVGVLSDSFNNLGGAAADEADGALPPAADIDVIKDLASGGTDEGRAMMQIIHDIAPGASLAFYTAFDSEQDFANGILALAAAGCKVIVDDVGYSDEPFFQNGIVAQAIQTVEAEGVTYVTAAGNEASNGYEAAWTPISGTFDGNTLTDAESFGGSLVETVSINTEGTGYTVPLVLEWNQAYGAATSDLELLVFNSSGRLVGTATNASGGESTNPWVEYDFTRSGTYYVAVENLSGPNPGLIKEITEGDGLPATISGANTGTVVGHAMTPGAITAGAVSAADTPAFGVSPAVSESFSSSGAGTELLFANNGTPLAMPDVLSPVAVSGVDDIATTLPNDLSDFYGTSAAAASLAGAAALILSADPNLTPAEVEQLMEETALPMANAAVSGAGLVQLDPAVQDVESGMFQSGITVTGTTTDAIQGGTAIAPLTAAPTITDVGQSNLASATVTIANGSGKAVAGDELYVDGIQNGVVGNGVTASWNATTDTLTLTGTATIAVYKTLLGEVTYQDTGTDTSTVGHPERTVTWTVNDGTNSFDTTSQVTIDRPPVAVNDTASDAAGSTITATAATGVLSIDSDLDGDQLTVTSVSDAAHGIVSVGNALAGVYGQLTLNANGSYSYLANNLSAIASAPTDQHPQDTFTYTVSDGNGGTATAELIITIDRAPIVTATNVTLNQTSVAATTLFSASDPDGNAITTYAFTDTGPGDFVLNGVAQPNNQTIDVTAAQLSQLTYHSGAGVDTIEISVYDGTLWSEQASFTVTPLPEPVVTATNQTVADNQSIPLTDLFSVSGSGISEYRVWFSWPQGGFPALGEVTNNGTPIALDQSVTVTSLSGLDYIGSAAQGTDAIWLQAYNGTWSSQAQADIVDLGGSASSNLLTSHTFQQGITINAGASLTVDTASNETVVFTGSTGALVLNDPEGFSGQIVGFTGTAPDAAHSDTIDLVDINYNSSRFTEAYNSTTGLLTATDGTNTAQLTFVDFNGTLDFASDGDGGTLITDPPASGPSSNPADRALFDWAMKFGDHKIGLGADASANQSGDGTGANSAQGTLVSAYDANDHFIFHQDFGTTGDLGHNAAPSIEELHNHHEAETLHQLTASVTPELHHETFIDLVHSDSLALPHNATQAQWHQLIAGSFHLH